MALVRSLLFFLIATLGANAVVFACSLSEEDMVELRRYVRSKCEGDLVVSEEVFGFTTLDEEIREASTLGGNLAVAANQKLMIRELPESKRNFSRFGALGGKLHMASIVNAGCTTVKFDKEFSDLVKMDLPDQMEAMNIGGKSVCKSAEKKLEEFHETQFSGECTSGGVVAYPARKVAYTVSRAPASNGKGGLKANIRSTGDPTANDDTRRPISVNMKDMQITYTLPFVGNDGKLLVVTPDQKASVENQIKGNLEEFIQMHDCCTTGVKSDEEKKICNRFNIKYVPKKAKDGTPSSGISN